MKLIPLTQGKFVQVDDEDYDWLNQWKWRAAYKNGNWYAIRTGGISMHMEIMQTPKGKETDHIDNNGLNNQRHNLRICTHLQNQQNKRKYKNNTSGYKGVSWNSKYQKWVARISIGNNKEKFLGYYDNPEIAARAYDDAALIYYKEFAQLNFSK